mmetsp:Transcript_16187/g.31732  ORF Transcript_16187/g.31732 Transcript_16187/m.31732 type:complete len:665 (-) Transcript_16187:220-2214(-)
MPPKKPAPKKKVAKAKPLDYAAVEAFCQDDTQVEEIALDMLDIIITNGAQILMDHYIDAVAKEQTANVAVTDAVGAVEWQLIQHDLGERDVNATEEEPAEDAHPAEQLRSRQVWLCEKEPGGCDVDRFARGMVKVKTKHKSRLQEFMNTQKQNFNPGMDAASTLYAPSVRTTLSGESHAPTSARSMLSQSRGGVRSRAKKKKEEPIQEVKQPYPIQVQKTLAELEKDKLRDTELKKMDKKKKAAAKAKRQAAQELEDKKRFEKLKNDLKGKNYTFDAKGNVILIHAANGDKLPDFSFAPRIGISDSESDDEDDPKKKAAKAKAAGKGKGKEAGKGGKKGKNADDDIPVNAVKRAPRPKVEHFIDAGAVASGPASDMPLARGVTMRTGNVAKKNKVVPSDLKEMTREQYNQTLNERNPNPTRKNSQVGAEDGEASAAPSRPESAPIASQAGPAADASEVSRQGAKDAGQSGAGSKGGEDNGDDEDVVSLSGAHAVKSASRKPSAQHLSRASLQAQNFVKGRARRASEEENEIVRINNALFDEKLLNDPSFGTASSGGGFQATNTKIPQPPSFASPKRLRPVGGAAARTVAKSALASTAENPASILNPILDPLPNAPSLPSPTKAGGYRRDWGRDRDPAKLETTDTHATYFGRGGKGKGKGSRQKR